MDGAQRDGGPGRVVSEEMRKMGLRKVLDRTLIV